MVAETINLECIYIAVFWMIVYGMIFSRLFPLHQLTICIRQTVRFFLFTLVNISAALRNDVTAKKLEGIRNWKVVASSDGRESRGYQPDWFHWIPHPSFVSVSSARSVLR